MPRYNFVSGGAAAGDAISKFLLEREVMNQEAMRQKFLQKKQEDEAKRQADALVLDQQREARISADSDANRDALEGERRFRRASTIATTGLPGVIDADTAGLLEGEGFGTLVKRGQPTQGADLGVDEQGVNQYAVNPGVMEFAGGSQYQNARAAEDARASQARETAAIRAEEAEKDRQMRATLAGMSNQGRAETTALRNDLLQTQVDAANQKAAEKEEAKQKSRQAARVTADQTVAVLKELADFDENGRATLKEPTKNLFGAANPLTMFGKETNDARAALNRVRGRVIVDLLNEMKNQSATGATGFGALSGPELELLQNAASELNSRWISNDRAAQELERIYNAARRLYGTDTSQAQDGGQQQQAGGGGRVYYDVNGQPVKR